MVLNPPYGKEILSSCNYLGFYLDSPKFHIVFIVTSVCQGIKVRSHGAAAVPQWG